MKPQRAADYIRCHTVWVHAADWLAGDEPHFTLDFQTAAATEVTAAYNTPHTDTNLLSKAKVVGEGIHIHDRNRQPPGGGVFACS